jgi:type II secretory pathway component GspD/PulD (secretin)
MIRTRPLVSAFITMLAVGAAIPARAQQPISARPTTPPAAEATKPAPEPPPSKACPDCAARRRDFDGLPTQAFYLKYATSANEMNEIATTLRQLLSPDDRTFVVPSQDAIVIRAIPEDLALAQKILDNLDRPKKAWRLTYTLTEIDGGKRLGSQHYSMVIADGQQATLKQGDRVPLTIASNNAGQNQVSYQDVGMSFDAQLNQINDGARLRSDVAQSSLADDKTQAAAQDPILRQSTLKSEATLIPNKPLVLGSMDMPGSTHSLQIEVLMEPLP